MSFPAVEYSTSPLSESDAEAILLAVPALSDAAAEDWSGWSGLRACLQAIGFTGAVGAYARVHIPDLFDRPVAVVGTGASATSDAVRRAIGAGMRSLTGFSSVAVSAPFLSADLTGAALEGAGLGGYAFATYKRTPGASRASRVVVHGAAPIADDVVDRARAEIEAVALVKDLVSTPADRLGPDDLAQRAIAETDGLDVTVEVWDEERLATAGFGGILGVGSGAARPPRLVRLDYAPAGASRHVSLVGKGITFDSGGLSLKPPAGMVDMKYDMCGAATVLAVLRAAARLALPLHVTAWMCVAENLPSGTATRPGDVLTMADGTTVEVLNTDAEGRLVLADGLVAASRENPDLIVDVATLTGAITTALGTRHVGVLGADSAVASYLEATRTSDELAWALPLPEHMEEELDSPIADLRNAKVGDPAGGSLFAGLFLRRFVGQADAGTQIPWVHLDIAGVGLNKGAAYGFTDKGPTGATTRTLIQLLVAEAAR